jgi:hypothetical protein
MYLQFIAHTIRLLCVHVSAVHIICWYTCNDLKRTTELLVSEFKEEAHLADLDVDVGSIAGCRQRWGTTTTVNSWSLDGRNLKLTVCWLTRLFICRLYYCCGVADVSAAPVVSVIRVDKISLSVIISVHTSCQGSSTFRAMCPTNELMT